MEQCALITEIFNEIEDASQNYKMHQKTHATPNKSKKHNKQQLFTLWNLDAEWKL